MGFVCAYVGGRDVLYVLSCNPVFSTEALGVGGPCWGWEARSSVEHQQMAEGRLSTPPGRKGFYDPQGSQRQWGQSPREAHASTAHQPKCLRRRMPPLAAAAATVLAASPPRKPCVECCCLSSLVTKTPSLAASSAPAA